MAIVRQRVTSRSGPTEGRETSFCEAEEKVIRIHLIGSGICMAKVALAVEMPVIFGLLCISTPGKSPSPSQDTGLLAVGLGMETFEVSLALSKAVIRIDGERGIATDGVYVAERSVNMLDVVNFTTYDDGRLFLRKSSQIQKYLIRIIYYMDGESLFGVLSLFRPLHVSESKAYGQRYSEQEGLPAFPKG